MLMVLPAQMHVPCASIAHEGQKGAPDTLELELLMVVSHSLGSGNGTESSIFFTTPFLREGLFT